jgi:hypothetical protein
LLNAHDASKLRGRNRSSDLILPNATLAVFVVGLTMLNSRYPANLISAPLGAALLGVLLVRYPHVRLVATAGLILSLLSFAFSMFGVYVVFPQLEFFQNLKP